ncbi:NTP transferase domain-containing protein [Agrobacterium larrymoorei]|uniref:NTP transferase domain-containing protein n=1 Tax=Agrobacterium larrymoorei TaxID=160699 RepID=UPI001571D365|nr:molybdopterin-binding/glycosyltransferase family 2 protein [Agrobacterium larrymoorei]NTJ43837.1 NTP transferase domain-containing protein [Agrobacterium larrymoorei]
MKFGHFNVNEADGLVLAHTLKLPDGQFAKGHVLQTDDLFRIAAAGLNNVIGVRMDEDDVGEDEAAGILSQSIPVNHLRVSEASTGRVNVYSTVKGIFSVEKTIVDQLNAIDQAITLACLSDHSRVNSGDMVATFKIIPLAVSGRTVEKACELLRERPPFEIRPFKQHAISLIATELPHLKPSVMDKTARILDRRLVVCGNRLQREIRVPHDTLSLSQSLTEVIALPDEAPKLIIVFGASAVIDNADVIPQAIREAGGIVLRVGMPVDPGNLIVLGKIGTSYIIGAPGCARSPKENGFDWVLERILAGEVLDERDIAGMGVGGLLMEIQTRPMPRDPLPEKESDKSVAIVILAAGMSSRMGSFHKLLTEFNGIPLIRRTAMVATSSQASSVTVVLGHRQDELKRALSDLNINIVVNPDYASGLSSSLATGFATAQASEAQGILVFLADMPQISTANLDQLITAFQRSGGTAIVRASSHGQPGNPVILPSILQNAVLSLEGDTGARHLIETSGLKVIEVDIGHAAQIDVDTPEAVIKAGGVLTGSTPENMDREPL